MGIIKATLEKIKNVKSSNRIGMISINNLRIGDKASENMKNLVMDSKNPYEFNKVHFSVDDNDLISQIVFYTTSSSDGTYGIKEAQVEFGQNKLIMVEDFNKYLGIGKEEISEKNPSYKYVKYNEGNYELILTIRENNIINIEIRKN